MNATSNVLTPIYPEVEELTSVLEYPPGNPEPDNVWKWLQQGIAILWTHAGISIGIVSDGMVEWKSGSEWTDLPWTTHLVELRAFNPAGEWRIWRTNGGLRNRTRKDTSMTNGQVKALDSQMKLRGVVGGPLQTGNETLLLKMRNYLGVDKTVGMTGYEDVRFMEIVSWKKGGLK